MQHERPSSPPTLGPTLASHRPYRRSTSGAMVGAFVCTVGTMHRNALAGADLLFAHTISACLTGIQMGVRWGSKVELVTKRGIQGVPTVQEIKGSRWGSAGDPGGILAQNGGSRGCRLCEKWGDPVRPLSLFIKLKGGIISDEGVPGKARATRARV